MIDLGDSPIGDFVPGLPVCKRQNIKSMAEGSVLANGPEVSLTEFDTPRWCDQSSQEFPSFVKGGKKSLEDTLNWNEKR